MRSLFIFLVQATFGRGKKKKKREILAQTLQKYRHGGRKAGSRGVLRGLGVSGTFDQSSSSPPFDVWSHPLQRLQGLTQSAFNSAIRRAPLIMFVCLGGALSIWRKIPPSGRLALCGRLVNQLFFSSPFWLNLRDVHFPLRHLIWQLYATILPECLFARLRCELVAFVYPKTTGPHGVR